MCCRSIPTCRWTAWIACRRASESRIQDVLGSNWAAGKQLEMRWGQSLTALCMTAFQVNSYASRSLAAPACRFADCVFFSLHGITRGTWGRAVPATRDASGAGEHCGSVVHTVHAVHGSRGELLSVSGEASQTWRDSAGDIAVTHCHDQLLWACCEICLASASC